VEILKFAEPPKRNSRAKTQKRGGLKPLLAVVLSVAVIGGMSTTLAGTITLNSGGSVEFGQGVVTTAACDTSIKIIPLSSFDTSTSTFSVSSIRMENIGTTNSSTDGAGCLGKKLTLKAYNTGDVALAMIGGTTDISVTIPTTALAAGTSANFGKSSDVTVSVPVFGSPGAGAFGETTSGVTTGYATNLEGYGYITLGNLNISGTVTRITLESSEASSS